MGLEKRFDLLILEDLKDISNLILEISKSKHLSSIIFNSGIDAIQYVDSIKKENLPISYLVDMKICENIPNCNLARELKSSEEIYNNLKSKNANLDLFTYMSGHRSHHDLGVLDRTVSNFVLKDTIFFNYLNNDFFPKVIEKKNSL